MVFLGGLGIDAKIFTNPLVGPNDVVVVILASAVVDISDGW